MLLTGAPAREARAQAPPDEARIKAAFVFNFVKFVEWPAGAFQTPSAPIVFAIVGDGATATATKLFLTDKQVGERPVVVRHLKWDEPLSGVHAVFVSDGDANRLRTVFSAAAASATLSIGEGVAFAERGGVIALLVEKRKVRFDVNTDAAHAAGLVISSRLLALTRAIHSSSASGVRP